MAARATKALHHVSINPSKDERLTDEQVLRIVARLEDKYGYAHGEHQRVIVKHIKDRLQHFHVIVEPSEPHDRAASLAGTPLE